MEANQVDTVYCKDELVVSLIFDYLIDKGYMVLQSKAEIETGTNGKYVAIRLDILE